MAETTVSVEVLAQRRYPIQKRDLAATAVPLGVSRITLKLDRLDWPDTGADIIIAQVEWSRDGGANYLFLAGFTTGGGDAGVDKEGNPVKSSISITIPEPLNANRMLRGNVEVKTALDTRGVLDLISVT